MAAQRVPVDMWVLTNLGLGTQGREIIIQRDVPSRIACSEKRCFSHYAVVVVVVVEEEVEEVEEQTALGPGVWARVRPRGGAERLPLLLEQEQSKHPPALLLVIVLTSDRKLNAGGAGRRGAAAAGKKTGNNNKKEKRKIWEEKLGGGGLGMTRSREGGGALRCFEESCWGLGRGERDEGQMAMRRGGRGAGRSSARGHGSGHRALRRRGSRLTAAALNLRGFLSGALIHYFPRAVGLKKIKHPQH
ncbi:hypothetical protein EYF80_019681 [Liparis tanakae]|uniref:Uncharacterized protein n=1 Tax=Liparis tanakae TaxID=230148 RepID=A0A4Z2HXD9_9TELE|nr:hypothetical protein EYF80_019681 [Liparis tanakae]